MLPRQPDDRRDLLRRYPHGKFCLPVLTVQKLSSVVGQDIAAHFRERKLPRHMPDTVTGPSRGQDHRTAPPDHGFHRPFCPLCDPFVIRHESSVQICRQQSIFHNSSTIEIPLYTPVQSVPQNTSAKINIPKKAGQPLKPPRLFVFFVSSFLFCLLTRIFCRLRCPLRCRL